MPFTQSTSISIYFEIHSSERISHARLSEYPQVTHVYLSEVGIPVIDDILAFLEDVDA